MSESLVNWTALITTSQAREVESNEGSKILGFDQSEFNIIVLCFIGFALVCCCICLIAVICYCLSYRASSEQTLLQASMQLGMNRKSSQNKDAPQAIFPSGSHDHSRSMSPSSNDRDRIRYRRSNPFKNSKISGSSKCRSSASQTSLKPSVGGSSVSSPSRQYFDDNLSSPSEVRTLEYVNKERYKEYIKKTKTRKNNLRSDPGSAFDYDSDSVNDNKIGDWVIHPQNALIGQGAFSRVYKGIDYNYWKEKGKHVTVAIKMIDNSDKAERAQKTNKWIKQNEIRCLERISHENVVKLFAHDSHARYQNQDVIAFVLEYCPHGDFAHLLQDLAPLSDKLGRTYFRQLMAGIDACHKAYVIHRDLKLDNLVLDSKYNLKICDFGFGKVEFNCF